MDAEGLNSKGEKKKKKVARETAGGEQTDESVASARGGQVCLFGCGEEKGERGQRRERGLYWGWKEYQSVKGEDRGV